MHVIDMPVTLATAVITVLALLFYVWTGISVARARGKHGVKAPTMTGPAEFECAVRVQANTLNGWWYSCRRSGSRRSISRPR